MLLSRPTRHLGAGSFTVNDSGCCLVRATASAGHHSGLGTRCQQCRLVSNLTSPPGQPDNGPSLGRGVVSRVPIHRGDGHNGNSNTPAQPANLVYIHSGRGGATAGLGTVPGVEQASVSAVRSPSQGVYRSARLGFRFGAAGGSAGGSGSSSGTGWLSLLSSSARW